MRKSEALKYRGHIETAVQSLPASKALEVIPLHTEWKPGITCEEGKRFRWKGKLYEVNKGKTHTAQADWPPDIATSLFTKVNETHSGTLDDPIPYSGGMVLENGKYYTQDDVIYLCTRDTVNPVYNALSELVGLYVEKA